jgi:hypothetical protein
MTLCAVSNAVQRATPHVRFDFNARFGDMRKRAAFGAFASRAYFTGRDAFTEIAYAFQLASFALPIAIRARDFRAIRCAVE